MIALAVCLGLLLPAIQKAAWIHSTSRSSKPRPFAPGAHRLLAIEHDLTIESAVTLNKYGSKAIGTEIAEYFLTSAIEIDTKTICGDLINPIRPPSQIKTQVESSNPASSRVEINIRSEAIPTQASKGESCGAELWHHGAASMRPKPWSGDMLGIRYHDALADAIIDISSRIALSGGECDHLKFSFASQRWRNAETISII